jgi:hypothetical protein
MFLSKRNEQNGQDRARYGENLLQKFSEDLSLRFGRGFSRQNLQQKRLFYQCYTYEKICQTLSGKLVSNGKCQTVSGKLGAMVESGAKSILSLFKQAPLYGEDCKTDG